MAQFMAIIRGQRGEATRLGSKKSGIAASINGWHNGIKVDGKHDEKTGEDVFVVSITGGSRGAIPETVVIRASASKLTIDAPTKWPPQ